MQAYFTASIVGKKQYQKQYEFVIATLKKRGCTVISDHIMKSSTDMIRMESREERLQFQQNLEKRISTADFVVAEASFPSISVGFEIALAYQKNKPVLVLYAETAPPPTLLIDHKNQKLICDSYTQSTLPALIEDFLAYIDHTEDMRFTFFINAKMAEYLQKISRDKKIPKSVYLRQLIEKDMLA